MFDIVDANGLLVPEQLVKQYELCILHFEAGKLYFTCGKCELCGECPVYGTVGYAKRIVPFCPYFTPNE